VAKHSADSHVADHKADSHVAKLKAASHVAKQKGDKPDFPLQHLIEWAIGTRLSSLPTLEEAFPTLKLPDAKVMGTMGSILQGVVHAAKHKGAAKDGAAKQDKKQAQEAEREQRLQQKEEARKSRMTAEERQREPAVRDALHNDIILALQHVPMIPAVARGQVVGWALPQLLAVRRRLSTKGRLLMDNMVKIPMDNLTVANLGVKAQMVINAFNESGYESIAKSFNIMMPAFQAVRRFEHELSTDGLDFTDGARLLDELAAVPQLATDSKAVQFLTTLSAMLRAAINRDINAEEVFQQLKGPSVTAQVVAEAIFMMRSFGPDGPMQNISQGLRHAGNLAKAYKKRSYADKSEAIQASGMSNYTLSDLVSDIVSSMASYMETNMTGVDFIARTAQSVDKLGAETTDLVKNMLKVMNSTQSMKKRLSHMWDLQQQLMSDLLLTVLCHVRGGPEAADHQCDHVLVDGFQIAPASVDYIIGFVENKMGIHLGETMLRKKVRRHAGPAELRNVQSAPAAEHREKNLLPHDEEE